MNRYRLTVGDVTGSDDVRLALRDITDAGFPHVRVVASDFMQETAVVEIETEHPIGVVFEALQRAEVCL